MNDQNQIIQRRSDGFDLEGSPATFHFTPNGFPGKDNQEPAETGLWDYLQIIRKHVWQISCFTILCTALAAFYMARKPDLYGAEARVQIDLESNPAVSVNGKPVVLNNPTNGPDYFETQLEILKGAGLLRRVVKTLDLEHNRAFFRPEGQRTTWQRLRDMAGFGGGKADGQLRSEQGSLITASVAPPSDREDLAEIKRLNPYVGAIQGGLDVEQVGHTRLVLIRYTHPDPQVAAKVANAIAETFVHSNLEKMSETNTGAATFLATRVADLQSQIKNGEERLQNYSREHQIISLNENQNTVVDRLNGLNRELLAAENERNIAETAYRSALTPGAADALAPNSAIQNSAETKLVELRQHLAELKSEYTDKWPEIRVVQEQINELEKQLSQSRTNKSDLLVKSLEAKFNEALQRERTVRAAFEKQRDETLTQNSAAINYRIIQQEIQTNQELLNGLSQRLKENEVILAGTPNNIRVADYANTPEWSIGPRRMRGVGLAFVFSLTLGIGLALLRELSNNTVRTTSDVSRKLRLPTIAVVPKMDGWFTRKLLASPKRLLAVTHRNGHERPLLLNEDTDPRLAEVYRKLRTTLILAKPGKSPKTILVTSSVPAEGKTTTAVNIATILAQTGALVLVIDADLRQPSLHQIFDLDNSKGLSTLLAQEAIEPASLTIIQQDDQTRLHVLTAGPIPPRPAELLATEHMRRLLEIASGVFDYVVIDSTPVMSCTDSVLISSLVDGVVLVVRGGKSPQEIVQHTRKELEDVGANIFGVVLNDAEVNPHAGYYYYRASA